MKINKPNHVCKYSGCTLGENGSPKHYYACDYCDRTNAWRASACCMEHYELYVQEVLEARSKNKKVDLLPRRTDKSKKEVETLLNTPIEEVKENTIEELKDYMGDGESLSDAVEKVNRDLDKPKPRRRKSK